MKPKDLIELVFQSLPNDINPKDLKSIGKKEWWDENPMMAIVNALTVYHRINWDAYLEDNPDVKEAGINPIVHFLKHGIYEGRKLKSWHSFHEYKIDTDKEIPKISIIVPNYNNEIFLGKCIRSLMNQTLHDIEIIVVDDCSQDASLKIAYNYEKIDKRIRVIPLVPNQGTHAARKIGVAHAKGKYIMFLDSDDFFYPDGCEQAYQIISKGYDIGVFECNVVDFNSRSKNRNLGRTKWFDRLPNGIYEGDKKMDLAFIEDKIPSFMGNKIFERCMAQKCFEKMENFYGVIYEDMYEFLILNYYARNLYKSDKIIFSYANVGISNSDANNKFFENLNKYLQVIYPFENFCKKHNLNKILQNFKKFLINRILSRAAIIDTEKSSSYLIDALVKFFGPVFAIQHIMEFYDGHWTDISFIFSLLSKNIKTQTVNTIAIYYYNITQGHMARSINALCNLLLKKGYNVVLILEEKNDEEICIDKNVKKYYISSSKDKKTINKHFLDFHNIVIESEVQLVIFMFTHMPIILWDTLLMKMMGISVIGALELDINMEMLSRGRCYNHSHMLQTLRCMDKILCPNLSSEIYLRSQGIDACKVPTFGEYFFKKNCDDINEDIILVLGLLGTGRRQSIHCLRILSEIIKIIPHIKMHFVGEFSTPASKENFYKKACELNVSSHIHVISWPDDISSIINKSKICLSTSYLDGYQDDIIKVQICCKPIVMYDIDYDLAKNNESIVRVQQGDYEKAAQKIINILQDNDELLRLTKIAYQNASQINSNTIIDIIKNFKKETIYNKYDIKDYQTAIRYMTFYAGKKWPAE